MVILFFTLIKILFTLNFYSSNKKSNKKSPKITIYKNKLFNSMILPIVLANVNVFVPKILFHSNHDRLLSPI